MCRKLICLVSFVVLVLCLISSAQAGEATADAFVRGPTYDNTNYGSDSSVTLKNTNGNSYDRKGYIRFDVAGAVSEATLVLTVSTNNEGGGGTTPQTFTVEVYGLAESLDHTWTETDITWNNAPGNDTSSSNFNADATLLGSFIVEPLPVGSVVSFNDPNLVDFINSDTDNQITILLRRTVGTSGSHNLGFASKEHTSYSPPTLNMRVATQASEPDPANEATDVARDAVLIWTPGIYAPSVNGHVVYLSDSFSDVNDGIGGITQDANSYTPFPRLDLGTTYYWRVDEVNSPPDSTVYEGKIWSFTTEPVGYPVDGSNITATASSAFGDSGPEKTIDGSGLSSDDLHSTTLEEMWLSDLVGPQPTWIEYQFDKAYKLHEMWVWNHNQTIEPAIGYGLKDVTIEYSVDGIDYTTLGTTHEFADALGLPDSEHETTVDLGGVIANYVRLTANSNWKGFVPQFGLSEVRFFHVPVNAREPSPSSGASDVDVNMTLGWRAGREAAAHDVYLSTDEQAVIDGTVPAVSLTDSSFSSAFDLGSTYYWRIDEVNDAETPTTWQGDIWSLTTQEFLVVEDFESYNDIEAGQDGSNLIYMTWADGFDNPATNGSTIGYTEAFQPTMESSIVFDGAKSVPLSYNNTMAPNSEVTANVADLLAGRDWSKYGIKALTLRFYGDPNNATQQMYVKINGAKVIYDGDAENIRLKGWQMWYIDLAPLGVNLSNVTTLTIGFERIGALGGQGMIFLDGLRLYSYDRQLVTPADPGAVGLQAHYEFDGTANDSSGNNRHGTAMGGATFAPGKTGQAVNLDGVDDYVTITGYKGIVADRSDPSNPVQMAFSVACWINTTGNGSLVGWGSSDGTGAGGQYQNFRIDGGRLRAEHGDGRFRGATVINDGEWHHVAMTVAEGVNLWPPGTQLYVDGQKDTEGADTVNAQNIWNLTPDADAGIGVRVTHNDRFFLGLIDDVRIYDRELTYEEVAALAGRTRSFDEPF